MFNVVGAELVIDHKALQQVSYLEAQAAIFAAKAHATQVRKYSGAPYHSSAGKPRLSSRGCRGVRCDSSE